MKTSITLSAKKLANTDYSPQLLFFLNGVLLDSMILPEISNSRGTLMFASPGIRWFASGSTAFQVGYPFYVARNGNLNESGAVPFPTFGLFVKM